MFPVPLFHNGTGTTTSLPCFLGLVIVWRSNNLVGVFLGAVASIATGVAATLIGASLSAHDDNGVVLIDFFLFEKL